MKNPFSRRVSHIIGRTSAIKTYLWELLTKTVDETVPDYKWWDHFRRGLQVGYELTGVLVHSMARILASYIVGRGVTIMLQPVPDKRMRQKQEYTNNILSKFALAYQALLARLALDWLELGDQYVIVNPDSSLIIAPPNTVEIEYDPIRPQIVLAYKFKTIVNQITIIDEYWADKRVVRIRKPTKLGKIEETIKTYRNLIGEIPVVEFNHDRDINSLRGRSIFYGLLRMLAELEDIMLKSFQGAKVAGNPFPVFENLDDPQETIDLLLSQTAEEYIDVNGDTETRDTINWDKHPALFLGSGGRFHFAGPAVGFTTDIQAVIASAMAWIRNYMQVPKVLLGGTDSLTEAESKGQLPAWVRFVEYKRDEFGGIPGDEDIGSLATGLHKLARLFLKTRKLVDSRIMVGPTALIWYDLTDDEETLEFEKVKWAHSRVLITDTTALHQMDLVVNATEEVRQAREESDEGSRGIAVETSFDDFGGDGGLSEDKTPDERGNNGADAPRMPANSGGGKR